jgi:hypothetical protein
MLGRLKASLPHNLGKWCAYALILLVPGSFIALPVMWLVRFFVRKDYLHVRTIMARHWGIPSGL